MATPALSAVTTNLQASIDQMEAANAALYAQRDALVAQIDPLQKQLSDILQQIAVAEGLDGQKLRASKRALDMISTNTSPGRVISL